MLKIQACRPEPDESREKMTGSGCFTQSMPSGYPYIFASYFYLLDITPN